MLLRRPPAAPVLAALPKNQNQPILSRAIFRCSLVICSPRGVAAGRPSIDAGRLGAPTHCADGHQSAGLETRDLLFTDLDAGAGAWVPTGASVLAFDRECAEAAYRQFGRRDLWGNLAEDRRNNDPAIVSTEMRVRTPSWPAL